MVGGWGEEKTEVTEHVLELCSTHKAACEEKLGRSFASFTPVAFTSQVVAGMNHRVKVRVCGVPEAWPKRGRSVPGRVSRVDGPLTPRQVDVGGGEFVHLRVFTPLPHTKVPSQLVACKLQAGDAPLDL